MRQDFGKLSRVAVGDLRLFGQEARFNPNPEDCNNPSTLSQAPFW